ncbi:MAG: response regulator, partial [Oscillospiraceae bacterium]
MYTLLLVDDETPILEGLRRTLDWKSYGFHRVETASTYEDAMTKAIDLNPDIAVFDVCIGPHRGYEIINHLKKMGLKTIYIMMSGYSDFEFARESLRCGAKEYLLKPIDTEKLRELIETVIVRDLHGTVSQRSINHVDMDPVLQLPYGAFPPLINKIQMLVQKNYQQNLSLKIIADKFKMNSTYLGQLFLKEVRLKFSEYLMLY